MRTKQSFNKEWIFTKEEPLSLKEMPFGEEIDLPHTWNALDGQDGGNDYYRGKCYYFKRFSRKDLPKGEIFYLELLGASSITEVYLNGEKAGYHEGGYSAFRVNLTGLIKEENLLAIAVDNSANDTVYPQMADFTFYGGIYRDVNLIAVGKDRFDLEYAGAPGIAVTPSLLSGDAEVTVEVYLAKGSEGEILFEIFDAEGRAVASLTEPTPTTKVKLEIKNPHLWQGVDDPYLYRARATLIKDGEDSDLVEARFGVRRFEVSPERGFILNGREYPLRGVSRHQDRKDIGNALLREHHEEDVSLILELGANTVRLAHYQHDGYFYDLCDEKGLVVWAEIPYISNHMPSGRENTLSQMKELIVQNYNHPSIFFWGISNEITMSGASDPDLIENHRLLNDLCHKLDPTRYTTMACLSMCSIYEDYVKIPDLVAYNHYFGWYGGEVDMNGEWFDNFHKAFPLKPIAISEYGAEALNWHSSNPTQGDYTEEYQAYYHEEMIKQLFSRRYIWATFVWNMFDFGADARAEGGENGQNHKGLVTFDRKYKKDSFYAYKAHLSRQPFVHIAGKRYVDRVEDVTVVTVYSNLDEVELFANGVSLGKKRDESHFFKFEVPNTGETTLEAVAGDFRDSAMIRKTSEINESYILKEKGALLNWFDVTEPEGCLSLNDKVDTIMATHEGERVLKDLMNTLMTTLPKGTPLTIGEDMMKMMGSFTLLRLTSLMSMLDVNITKDELLTLNRRLNRIRKK